MICLFVGLINFAFGFADYFAVILVWVFTLLVRALVCWLICVVVACVFMLICLCANLGLVVRGWFVCILLRLLLDSGFNNC